jgi:solute carrier family 25 protein 38
MGDVVQIDTGFEGYPPDSVIHNLPLIVLSGLCPTPPTDDNTHFPDVLDDSGSVIESELPEVTGKRAEQLLQEFRSCEKSDQQWNNKPVPGKSTLVGFKFRVVGRVG